MLFCRLIQHPKECFDRKACKICLEAKIVIICSINNKHQNKQATRNSDNWIILHLLCYFYCLYLKPTIKYWFDSFIHHRNVKKIFQAEFKSQNIDSTEKGNKSWTLISVTSFSAQNKKYGLFIFVYDEWNFLRKHWYSRLFIFSYFQVWDADYCHYVSRCWCTKTKKTWTMLVFKFLKNRQDRYKEKEQDIRQSNNKD